MRLQYKTTTKYLFFSLPFYLMLFACGLQITDVEYALREAGENRGELEAVLSHYAKLDDRQKLEAAQYLIRYMPYHTSYDKGIEDYYHAIDSVVALSEDKLEQEKHIESLRLRFESKYKQKRDIEVITSEFLIQSIDEAFKQWRECEWAEHLDFEQFCEYLLPYKCFEGQPLTEWRNAYYDICKGDIDLAYLCDEYKRNPIFAATEVNNQMKNTPQSFGLLKTLPIYDPDIILKLPFSNCATYCLGAVLIMRSKGIPVAYDFTPNWSTGNNGHSWNTVYTTRFGNLEFAPHTTDPGTVHYPYLKVPKIFRNVYKPNEEYLKITTEKYIPPKLRNMFIRDVTAEYMPTIDIRISLQESLKSGQSPFIAIYDGNNWTPVYWGKIAGSHVVFERMGLNTCYIALAYDSNGNAIPISKPFLASASKHIQFIEPDTSAFRTIRLNRKYPLGDNVFSIRKKITGGIIETSENREFDHTKKIAELPQGNLTNGTVFLDKNAEYRYWRFTSSDTSQCDMAEIYFYDEHDSIIQGNIIKCTNSIFDKSNNAANIADGDQLTNFSAKGEDWVGFDFCRPVNISKISYIRRCDGNSIQPGLEYSLYYWDNNNWQLINTKIANDIFIEFENVPQKALLAIKCSQGKQQRIFVCDEDNKIDWY